MADWHDLYNALNYVYGQCTQFVAGSTSWIPAGLGNGCQWLERAKAKGFQTTMNPTPGSIAVYDCGLGGSFGNGHVAKVDKVNGDGSFLVSEANWDGFNEVDHRTESLSSGTGKHIIGFILPPGVDASVPTDSGTQLTSFNPFDNIGLTISKIGKEIEQDLFKVALVLLGVFVVFLGLGLLLTSGLRSNVERKTEKIPGVHALGAEQGLKTSEEIAA